MNKKFIVMKLKFYKLNDQVNRRNGIEQALLWLCTRTCNIKVEKVL